MQNRLEELRWLREGWPKYRYWVHKRLWPMANYIFQEQLVWHWAINRFSLTELLWASGALTTYAGRGDIDA